MKEIHIIYEDSNVLVIDKPAGLLVHPDGREERETLVDWLRSQYSEIEEVGEPMKLPDGTLLRRPGIVHRLDEDTSGVMMVAKNQESYQWLKKEFQERRAQKAYRALLYGTLEMQEGEEREIKVPIGRSLKDPRLRVASPKAYGKLREAETVFKLLENFEQGYAYVEAYPKTGRTHQIRVHFKYLQHPLVCDRLYAPEKPCLPPLERQALHAFSLDLNLPGVGESHFEASLPLDFQVTLDNLKA